MTAVFSSILQGAVTGWKLDVVSFTTFAHFDIEPGEQIKEHVWRHFSQAWKHFKTQNRTFYSCLLSDLAFEWQRGWSWACFDTDLTAFVVLIKLFLC